jgi:cysteine-rich repeat protein
MSRPVVCAVLLLSLASACSLRVDFDAIDAAPGDLADAEPGAPDATAIDAPPGFPDAATDCGNGVVEGNEQCDDGNAVDNDACRVDCRRATCGDGVTRAGVEACDDGNTQSGDTCSSSCQACAGGFTDDTTGHCYQFVDTPMSWPDALAECQSRRGYLGVLTTTNELELVGAHAPGFPYWTGLNDIDSEGDFRWFDGEPVIGQLPFAFGQPNGTDDNNDCVWAQSAAGDFNDLGCASQTTSRPLCEIDGAHVRPEDGHAYLFLFEKRSPGQQATTCVALGAHLAVIDAPGEAAFLAQLATGAFWVGPETSGTSCDFVALAAGTATAVGSPCLLELFAICEKE